MHRPIRGLGSRRLKPAEFERRLPPWLAASHDAGAGRLLAIAGKAARHGFDTATARSAPRLVGVRAVSQRLSIGGAGVEKKGNEVTAIPEVLEPVERCGAIVTIDAMGCQTEIARQIVEAAATTSWPSSVVRCIGYGAIALFWGRFMVSIQIPPLPLVAAGESTRRSMGIPG